MFSPPCKVSRITGRRPHRWSLLWVSVALVLGGCVSTVTSRSVDGPPGAGTERSNADSPATTARDTADEVTRRANIRLEMASGFFQRGNYRQALEETRRALEIKTDYPVAIGLEGLIYMAAGDRALASTRFRRALELNPADPEIQSNYAWFLCQEGKSREALTHFDRAASDRLYSQRSKTLSSAGVCLLRAQDEAGAERYLGRAFEADPSNPVAMYHLAELLLKRGSTERAAFYAERLMTSYRPTAEALWLATRIAHRAGDRPRQERYSGDLMRDFPDSPQASAMRQGQYAQ